MKYLLLTLLYFVSISSFCQETEWQETEAEITEITVHGGKRSPETAIVSFHLQDGTQQMAQVSLFKIPLLGSMKSVGDKISIKYDKNNPVMAETNFGNFLSSYGMYIFIFLGVIFSIKPLLGQFKKQTPNS